MTVFKKARRMLAATLAGMLLLASAAFASQSGTVHCSTYLNVRSAGNTGAPVIGKLSNGSTVTVLGSANGWYQISWNGGSAWVSGLYVTVSGSAQTVVNTAKSMEGVKYVYGGASPSGFDCSGLVVYCYKQIGVTLPHSAAQLATKGTAIARTALQPGDLVFFDTDGGNNSITHVGIYIGNNLFVSAQSGAGYVKEASLSNSYWSGVYMGARRIL